MILADDLTVEDSREPMAWDQDTFQTDAGTIRNAFYLMVLTGALVTVPE